MTPNPDKTTALFLVSRGFAAAAWGVTATMLLFSTHATLDAPFLPVRVPAYMFGAVLTAWGARRIEEGLMLLRADPRAAQILLLTALVQLYMAPFSTWYGDWPMNPFFLGNFAALTVALLSGMLLVNITAAQVFRLLLRSRAVRYAAVPAGLMFCAVFALSALMLIDVARMSSGIDCCFLRLYRIFREPWWLIIGLNVPALLTMCVCRHAHNAALALPAWEEQG